MKIVLSTSPHIKHSAMLEANFTPRNDLMFTFAPLGLLMLCATLRDNLHITPIIHDINYCINNNEIRLGNSFYELAARSILSHDPEVLGFMTECDSYHHVLQICENVKKIKPECYIILGGPHATAVALPTIKKWKSIDAIVLGEGELTIVDLISRKINKEDSHVLGAVLRNKKGDILLGESRELIEHLDQLPFPAYDLYNPTQKEELFIEVGRGCPFQCTFCSTSPFWSRKHRVKSPKRIVEEIIYIKTLHNTNRFHFTHDLFTANLSWVEEVCIALIEAKLNINWTCSSRIDTITEHIIELMAKAGCNAIFFGIESGSERVLEIIQKKIELKQAYQIVSLCNKYGITSNAGLIVGFPCEDNKSFKDTFDCYLKLLKLNTKPLHIFSYCPFAQSTLYSSLTNLECSGHYMDLPLSEQLKINNKCLIKNDEELFGSYFRTKHKNIPQLRTGMLYAIDEFAILVDAVRIPSILIADQIGGMDQLFLKWANHIQEKNNREKKDEYRKYFGSPIDFCEFLKYVYSSLKNSSLEFIPSLIEVLEKNLEISAKFRIQVPNSMATYRSKTLDKSLTKIRFESTFISCNIIESLELSYDVVSLLNSTTIPENFVPNQSKTNLVWQKDDYGNISLIQVNDFIFHLIKKTKVSQSLLQEVIDSWINSTLPEVEIDLEIMFSDLQLAVDKEIINIETKSL